MANISVEASAELRKAWAEKLKNDPNLKCDHPNTRKKERYKGLDTGDRICPNCGDIK